MLTGCLQIRNPHSPFFVTSMPPSKRKTRRKAADVHEASEKDHIESSPPHPSPKKRKVMQLNPNAIIRFLTGLCLDHRRAICTAAPNVVTSIYSEE
jgi:hypothetical protein